MYSNLYGSVAPIFRFVLAACVFVAGYFQTINGTSMCISMTTESWWVPFYQQKNIGGCASFFAMLMLKRVVETNLDFACWNTIICVWECGTPTELNVVHQNPLALIQWCLLCWFSANAFKNERIQQLFCTAHTHAERKRVRESELKPKTKASWMKLEEKKINTPICT